MVQKWYMAYTLSGGDLYIHIVHFGLAQSYNTLLPYAQWVYGTNW